MTVHEFDPEIARQYGINAALVYQHLCWCSDRRKGGTVKVSTRNLAGQYPYLGYTAVREALTVLLTGTAKAPALVTRRVRPGSLVPIYMVSPIEERDGQGFDLHKFGAEFAAAHGIIPAIIHSNVRYWVLNNWENGAKIMSERLDERDYDLQLPLLMFDAYDLAQPSAWYGATPAEWAKRHAYASLSTVERGFAHLLKAGSLRKAYREDRKPYWSLPRRFMDVYACNRSGINDLKNLTVKSAQSPSNPRTSPSNPRSHRQIRAEENQEQPANTGPNAVSSPVTSFCSGSFVSKAFIKTRFRLSLRDEAGCRTRLRLLAEKERERGNEDAYEEIMTTFSPGSRERTAEKKDRKKKDALSFGDPPKREYRQYDPEDYGDFEDWRVERWQKESGQSPVVKADEAHG